jgi:hypothetical protein
MIVGAVLLSLAVGIAYALFQPEEKSQTAPPSAASG